ncbi:ferritin-like protein [Streptomyces sp. NPDC095602]|uniref:ferritin-like domain-containing protein n=1 Tax=Streptomyces sp. NPDC095602 TaxID=3155819 RepID=UPI00331C2C68
MHTVPYTPREGTARGDRVVELMRQPAELRDAAWVRDALQQAVLLELATLPPYLCGMWSVDEPGSPPALGTLRTIVFDEMSHLGLACNLLTTTGGTPRLADEALVPRYPGPLPGGVRPELTVYLSGLTADSVKMYASIEKPDTPVTRSARESFTSIGAFYTAILEALRADPGLITGARQVSRDMAHHGSGNTLTPLTTLAEAEAAITVIKEQGEGTSTSPENPHPGSGGELAHYYAFMELVDGRVPLPAAFPMGVVPEGGWPRTGPDAPAPPVTALLDKSNRAYSDLLRTLEEVWSQDDPAQAADLLGEAEVKMFTLRSPARDLMRRPLPDGSGKNYGPEFRYTPP